MLKRMKYQFIISHRRWRVDILQVFYWYTYSERQEGLLGGVLVSLNVARYHLHIEQEYLALPQK